MRAMIQGRNRTEPSRSNGMSRRWPNITGVPLADALLRQLAMLEMEPRLAEARHQALIMGRDDEGGAEPVHLLEEPQQPDRHRVIDVAGGLVGEQQARPADDGAGDGDALLLPARERRRPRIELVGEPDPVAGARVTCSRACSSSRPATRSGKATLSKAERWSIRRKSWNTTPILRRSAGSSRRGVVAMSRPKSEMRPRDGRSARYMSLKSVVLPAPLGPVRKWNEPAASCMLMSRNTSGPAPYRMPTFSKRTKGARTPSHRGASIAARAP